MVTTGCNGFCANGPIVVVKPDDIFYQFLKAEDIPHLVEEHCLKGRPVPELMYSPAEDAQPIPKMSDIPFFGKQQPHRPGQPRADRPGEHRRVHRPAAATRPWPRP